MTSQNNQGTQVSIDLNLTNHNSTQQLPRIGSKKNIQAFESPKSSRSRVGTEFFIGYDQKQSNLSLLKQQQTIDDNKIKFSMMMDLPFVITGKEFLQRGKTYNAFKKVDLLNNLQDNCQMKGIIIKRTSPIQEIQTSKKLGDAYYRKKKSRQTGTVFTCELWSRSYYDHILNKTQLKQLHLKMQESSKCKNYDERVEDIHRLFSKWQKQQSSFQIDYKDFLIQNDCNNSIYLDTSQNIHSTFEESLNFSKKSKFFQAVNTETDQFQEDSLLENYSDNNYPNANSKEIQNFSNKIKQFDKLNNTSTSFHHINITQDKSKTDSIPCQQNAKEMKYSQSSKSMIGQKSFTESKTNFKPHSIQKGFMTQRSFVKKGKEQNTSVSTNYEDQSTCFNEGYNSLSDSNRLTRQSNIISNRSQQIKNIFKNCQFLIKDCQSYKQESKSIKKEIDGYLKEQILDQKEIKKRAQERQLSDLLHTSVKSS
ncbi:hypothetical protein TTHERM_00314900 (macronuclear) [Tetrahymena thermophila SB210]|uniref:Uncharacterized protein n=1 Tax=Tetrahymena thermophila (strain SB210) TaxID=312017 RepID=I7LW63_TETTS|nr:hypothetical protein TTHERM_00314900 [Tetrahymena thermophila SB210]EAS01036.2 hypothetical protein TTHERM_00314900 [Tetrahymena thermophila SB210]|eukprot:XP_001021281.2 hypothetical protein TTHERM_00314900 [Tetrahymena thermophila SB210]